MILTEGYKTGIEFRLFDVSRQLLIPHGSGSEANIAAGVKRFVIF
jgi:hypothetical protein